MNGAVLNISCNRAKSTGMGYRPSALISFSSTSSTLCLFQFISSEGNLDNSVNKQSFNFSVVFSNNHNFTSLIYGATLNSCQWLDKAYSIWLLQVTCSSKFIIQYDSTRSIIARQQATLCYCDKITKEIDCFRDNFTTVPIYPGQTIPINLIQMPEFQPTVIYERQLINYITNVCQLKSINSLQLIPNNCTSLFYKAFTTTLEPCVALFSAVGFNRGGATLYSVLCKF